MTPDEIRAWRKKHKVSQDKLSKLLDVSTSTVISWETGRRNAPDRMLRLALEALEKHHSIR